MLCSDHVKDPLHVASVLWRPCLYDESLAKETDRGTQNSDKEEVEESWQKLGVNQRTIEAMQLHECEPDGFLLLGGSSSQTAGEPAARIPSPGGV